MKKYSACVGLVTRGLLKTYPGHCTRCARAARVDRLVPALAQREAGRTRARVAVRTAAANFRVARSDAGEVSGGEKSTRTVVVVKRKGNVSDLFLGIKMMPESDCLNGYSI